MHDIAYIPTVQHKGQWCMSAAGPSDDHLQASLVSRMASYPIRKQAIIQLLKYAIMKHKQDNEIIITMRTLGKQPDN